MSRLLLVLLVCFTAQAHGASSYQVQFPVQPVFGQTGPALTIPATLYKPPGAGPFAAVVVLHHCGGIDSALHVWARNLADKGYVTIVPDSFGPRGTRSVCATGQVRSSDRVADAYAAANYLRAMPEVRGDCIGLTGFSHGAGTIADLALRTPPANPFRAAVAFYPWCPVNAGVIYLPTLILVGANDNWTPAAACKAWGDRTGNPDKLNVVVYPNAFHRFDGGATREVFGTGGKTHHIQYDAAATADANAKAEAFLDRWLK